MAQSLTMIVKIVIVGTLLSLAVDVNAATIYGTIYRNNRNTTKVALSTLFTRIEQSWRLYSSVEFVGLCIARSSSAPETCNHSQGEFSAIANNQPLQNIELKLDCLEGSVRTDSRGTYRVTTNHMGRCKLSIGNASGVVIFYQDPTRYDFDVDETQLRRR